MMLDPNLVRQSVENLKLTHPELLEDNEAWLATLESETSFEELLTSVVRRIEDTKALVVGTKDRFEELQMRRERFDYRIEALRNLLFLIMQTSELAKYELPEATLSLRAGQQQLISKEKINPASLPDSLCKISRSPNYSAIKEALKTGQTVPGFSLSNASPSLTIRIK